MAAHGIAVLSILAYDTGCVLAGAGFPAPMTGRMVMQAFFSWVALVAVRRAARLCDQVVRRAAERRIAAAVERAQRAEELAHLALLHDTASTTFLMVSTNATKDFAWLPAQARYDLELLTDRAHPATSDVDLAELLATLADYQGLTVEIDISTDTEAGLLLPATPAYAIYHGVREALTNVRRHAGDPRPTVHAHDDDSAVVVRVSDRGKGFEPAAVSPHRRGLSHSVRARMTAVGGRTEIRSRPGQGTTVQWMWSRA